MRKATGTAALVVAVVVAIAALAAGCAGRPAVEGAGGRDLEVMTFNIRYGTADDGANAWPHRRDLVIGVIRRCDPDLLGLQEALRFQLDELAEALPGYGRIGVGRDDGRSAGEHSAILYRTDRLRLDESGTFWFSDTPAVPGSMSWGNEIPRIATWGRFTDFASGRTLLVYDLHLDHRSEPSRERSVELLSERIALRARAGEPVIVTGDFNAVEDTRAMRFVRGELSRAIDPAAAPRGAAAAAPPPALGLLDTFRVVHPDTAPAGTFNGFQGTRDGPKIDYVLVSPDVPVLAAEIVRDESNGRYPSDHFPVTARVGLGRD